ncbi:proteobacterial dedicated sortase system histidine kinase [Kistimonas scapharcae]|uniref:histidine kinase n=1 Tax=Kistimonas scapharcae TaxID=1036133 RepID=A0ABP8V4Z8_9GAMM
MKLSRQLMLVSLLVLVLPWAGVQSVRDMEASLRDAQAQVLEASLQTIATSLEVRQQIPEPVTAPIEHHVYAWRLESPLMLDGYEEDWQAQGVTGQRVDSPSGINIPFGLEVNFKAATDDETLYLFWKVADENIVYHNPSLPSLNNGDRLLLKLQDESGQVITYTIATEAPGPVLARYIRTVNGRKRVQRENLIRGFWRDTPAGYQLELAMPLLMAKAGVGFSVINAAQMADGSLSEQWTGTVAPAEQRTGPLITPDLELREALSAFLKPGVRLGVINNAGWLLAGVEETVEQDGSQHDAEMFWLLEWLYNLILSHGGLPQYHSHWHEGRWVNAVVNDALAGRPASQWVRDDGVLRLVVAWPLYRDGVIAGALVAEQGSEKAMLLAGRAFNRLFSLSFLAMLVTVVGLLGYAGWLSLRIQRLNRAAEQAFGVDGRVRDVFPASHMSDEIGQLSRSFERLLGRLREHTDYLRSLGSKLSHELRTPLAVMRSSLDNLSHEPLGEQGGVYLRRAEQGAARLSAILTAINEATRLEAGISNAEKETVDIRQMLEELSEAYRAIYPDAILQIELPDTVVYCEVAPELVVQALDKLVSNAVDFCPSDGTILIRLRHDRNTVCIDVENDGPLLPEAMAGRLFDSMVSVRDPARFRRGNRPPDDGNHPERLHLGLGLYIVRLVMEYHHGTVKAINRPEGSGVVFSLAFK